MFSHYYFVKVLILIQVCCQSCTSDQYYLMSIHCLVVLFFFEVLQEYFFYRFCLFIFVQFCNRNVRVEVIFLSQVCWFVKLELHFLGVGRCCIGTLF